MPAGTSITRFSTWPSAPTRITSARPAPIGANSICLIAPSDLGASTMPAAWLSPDSMVDASASMSCRLRPRPDSARPITSRSSAPNSPNCSSPSTNRRRPRSVGSRPAEVCGANSSPASVRSAMTLRIVAGESAIGSRRASVRLPTGSPLATYCSTISRSTAAARGSSPGGNALGGNSIAGSIEPKR